MENLLLTYHSSYIPSKILEDNFIVSDQMGFIKPKKFHYKRKSFNNYLLLYVSQGEFQLNQYGNHYVVKQDECIILSLRDEHEYYCTDNASFEASWMHFRGGNIEKIMELLASYNYLPLICENDNIKNHINQIFNISKNRKIDFEYEISSQIYQIIIMLTKNSMCEIIQENSNKDSWFTTKIDKYIDSKIYSKITLKELSREVNLTEGYFNNVFKKYYNKSPHQLILEKKLNFSIKLLRDTNQSISEISYALSFTDQSHYSNLFKKTYGMSPLKYRKIHKKD